MTIGKYFLLGIQWDYFLSHKPLCRTRTGLAGFWTKPMIGLARLGWIGLIQFAWVLKSGGLGRETILPTLEKGGVP